MKKENEKFILSHELHIALDRYIQDHYIETGYAQEKPQKPADAADSSNISASVLWKGTDADDFDLPPQSIRLDHGLPQLSDSAPVIPENRSQLDAAMKQVGKTFQQKLFQLIDERGFTDTEVYRRANIDRRLFSKIRHDAYYHPKKKTVLALCAALCLDLSESRDLLGRAELAFSPASKADLIVEFCIEHRIYDLYKINALLEEYGQPLL